VPKRIVRHSRKGGNLVVLDIYWVPKTEVITIVLYVIVNGVKDL